MPFSRCRGRHRRSFILVCNQSLFSLLLVQNYNFVTAYQYAMWFTFSHWNSYRFTKLHEMLHTQLKTVET